MKMRLTGLLVLCSVLFITGCNSNFYKGMNAQRSSLRGVGDISISCSLDAISSVETTVFVKDQTVVATEAVRRFLQDGKVADFTIPEITTELTKLIPEKFRFLLDVMIAQISGVTVPVGKIGVDNVRRIDALCVGILNGCAQYKIEDRPAPGNVLPKDIKKEAVKDEDIVKFGNSLRLQVKKNKK